MKPASFFFRLLITCFAGLLFISCSTAHRQSDKKLLESIKSVLILPVQAAPEKKEAYHTELETGIMAMNTALINYFDDKEYAKLFTAVDEMMKEMPGGNRLTLIQNLGRKYNCDAVLTCNLSRYTERKGKTYAIESPASVAFDCKLIEVKTGRAACFFNFDETQQALTENLLTLSGAARRGFKWLTAKELLNDGLNEKLSGCPYVTR